VKRDIHSQADFDAWRPRGVGGLRAAGCPLPVARYRSDSRPILLHRRELEAAGVPLVE
jgi:hypothetical protein